MKKVLIIFFSIIGLLVFSLILGPILFKDQIFNRVKEEANASLNADLNLSSNNFSLSIFNNFPNLTISLEDFSVVGRGTFMGDTLFSAANTSLEIDLFEVLKDNKISVKGISLEKPLINILVLEDGSANYDITLAAEEESTSEDSVETSDFTVAIDHWSISEGRISYYDQPLAVALSMIDVNHSGSGDFTSTIFDMNTSTEVNDFSLAYDGDVYMAHKEVTADMLFGMDLEEYKFTFKDATAKINDLGLAFEGYFAMPSEDYQMDIKFSANNNTFKSVLSIVPGMYAEGFDDLTTQGNFDLDGEIKGVYSDTKMPSYVLNLIVNDGYIKSKDVPLPIERINTQLSVNNPSGQMKDGSLTISNFSLMIDKSPFTASASVQDFNSPSWDLQANGILNLDIISKIEPTTEFSLGGIIEMALNSKGNMQALESENYEALSTSGSVKMRNFSYQDANYPKAKISDAMLEFGPSAINLNSFEGSFGQSDFSLQGSLKNYMSYALEDDGSLQGSFTLNSSFLNLNEFMSEESAESSTEEDTSSLELILVPKNLDFTFDASIAEIIYDSYTLKNAKGKMSVKDGVLSMQPLTFDMLGGSIELAGTYNTEEEEDPKFQFDMKMSEVGIEESFKQFTSIQKFVPIAEKMRGRINTDFGISGKVMQDMMPDLASVSGKGIIKVLQAAVVDSKLISGVTSLTKLDQANQVSLEDLLLKASIEDGKFSVEPFDFKLGKYAANVGGSTSLDGGLDYRLKVDVPTGALGQQANATISNLLGSNTNLVGDEIKLNFSIGGSYNDPKIKLLGSEGEKSATSAAKNIVNEKVSEGKKLIKKEVDDAKDSAKAVIKQAQDSAQKALEKEAEKKKEELKNKAKKKLKSLFGDGK